MTGRLPRLFILGLGYTALRFIELNHNNFSSIYGTVRSPDKVHFLNEKRKIALPFTSNEALQEAKTADVILISVPPDKMGDPALTEFGDVIAEARQCKWLGYLSTTGVYGDRGGAWTDETVPVNPSTPQSLWRVKAEQEWQEWGRAAGINVNIFRLSGIYGPGRNALEAMRRGDARRIIKSGQFFNRIHVDDIAAILLSAIKGAGTSHIYNLSDDEPSPPQDVVSYAADLLGMEPPPEIAFEQAVLSPALMSFYSENKRICNQRIKSELGAKLVYPTYREGLKAIFAG